MTVLAATTAFTESYRRTLAQLREHAVTATQRAFDARILAEDWHDAGAAQFASTVSPVVTAAQTLAVQHTAAYFRILAEYEADGALGASVDAAPYVGARGDVPFSEVYTRPFTGLWIDLHKGRVFAEAVAGARADVARETLTDVQLANVRAGRDMISADPRIVGWWRVPSPNACPFCRLISTRLYYRDSLMPVHARCGCTQRPAWRSEVRPTATQGLVSKDYGLLIDEAALRPHLENA